MIDLPEGAGVSCAKKVVYDQRDFFKQPFTADELRALLKSLGLRAHDVLSTKSPAFRANPFDPATKSENALIGLMLQEPRLIRRPLMAIEGKVVIGFDKEKLTEVLKK